MVRRLLVTMLMAAGTATAAPGPHGLLRPPPPIALSPEALASVPGLDASKQVEVRKILLERRDAHDALRAKEDAEREAVQARYRAEHDRIDGESSARLRKLLGEDGYHTLAVWLIPAHGGPPGRPLGPRDHAPGRGPEDPTGAEPPAPDADGEDPQVRVH